MNWLEGQKKHIAQSIINTIKKNWYVRIEAINVTNLELVMPITEKPDPGD